MHYMICTVLNHLYISYTHHIHHKYTVNIMYVSLYTLVSTFCPSFLQLQKFSPWHVFVAAGISPSFQAPWTAEELRVDSWAKTPGVDFHLKKRENSGETTAFWRVQGKRPWWIVIDLNGKDHEMLCRDLFHQQFQGDYSFNGRLDFRGWLVNRAPPPWRA